jgi:zinc D-Ala-D-Ala dipeptidase
MSGLYLSATRRSLFAALAAVFVAQCASAQERPADFVDAATVVPGLIAEMRYAGSHNFVGRPIDGYEAPHCLLTRAAANALADVARDVAARGLVIKAFDCYRPTPAVANFVGHSRGSTIDLTLAHADGHELDMGTPFDFFSPKSWPADPTVGAEVHKNRMLLAAAMHRHGFRGYDKEWWHFTLRGEPFPDTYFNFVVK